jgi:hypothetical protein
MGVGSVAVAPVVVVAGRRSRRTRLHRRRGLIAARRGLVGHGIRGRGLRTATRSTTRRGRRGGAHRARDGARCDDRRRAARGCGRRRGARRRRTGTTATGPTCRSGWHQEQRSGRHARHGPLSMSVSRFHVSSFCFLPPEASRGHAALTPSDRNDTCVPKCVIVSSRKGPGMAITGAAPKLRWPSCNGQALVEVVTEGRTGTPRTAPRGLRTRRAFLR